MAVGGSSSPSSVSQVHALPIRATTSKQNSLQTAFKQLPHSFHAASQRVPRRGDRAPCRASELGPVQPVGLGGGGPEGGPERAQERQDKTKLKEEVEELRAQLDHREVELKVRRHQAARTNKLLLHPQDLLRRQEILVKSQRRQMGVEMRKR